MTEKRCHPRRASYIIVEYAVAEGIFRDIMKTISAGGFFVRTDRSIAVGQTISASFPLFDFETPVHIEGRVTRRDPDGFAVTFNEPIKGLVCEDGRLPEIVHESDRIKS